MKWLAFVLCVIVCVMGAYAQVTKEYVLTIEYPQSSEGETLHLARNESSVFENRNNTHYRNSLYYTQNDTKHERYAFEYEKTHTRGNITPMPIREDFEVTREIVSAAQQLSDDYDEHEEMVQRIVGGIVLLSVILYIVYEPIKKLFY